MFWYKKKFIFFNLCITIFYLNVFSQLPTWKVYQDLDGNKYYIDKNAKIWTSEKPDFRYKAVSFKGLDYYLKQGLALIKNGYKVEGLTLLKSIKILGDLNPKAYYAAVKASNKINQFLKREGDRFKKIDQAASLLLVKFNNKIYVYNDYIPYNFYFSGSIAIIKRKIVYKHNYVRSGISFGIKFSSPSKKDKPRYDLLLIINSEKFHYSLSSITKYILMCKKKSVPDNFQRKILLDKSNQRKVIFKTEDSNNLNYMGYELYYIKGKYGYFIQVISEKSLFENKRGKIDQVINSLKIP